jgi:CelD/BcsL family acetyltransferase involved in cellulose biosynthesis
MAIPSTMQVDEIRDYDAFVALEPEWTAFVREQGVGSLFASHRWFRCCWSGRPSDARPLVLVVRQASRIVGIVPFFQRRASWRIFPARVLFLMQSHDSPFADLVLPRENAPRVVDAVLRHLATARGWDVLGLLKIARGSRTHGILRERLENTPHVQLANVQSPVLELDTDWKTFWTAQSQRFKKTVRNVVNRVERLGAITVAELTRMTPAAECAAVFRMVEGKSWKVELPTSLARSAEISRFFEALTTTLHASGDLLLWVLQLDGVPIATEYHVRDGDAVYALRSDFDDRYRDASPGAYLNHHIIREYFARGIRRYDMGPGESTYKQRWANGTVELDNLWIFNRTPYGMALHSVERWVVPRSRQAKGWLSGRRSAAKRSEERDHA